MQFNRSSVTLAALLIGAVVVLGSMQVNCQGTNGPSGPFSSSRPAAVIFEPTLSFIRQNMRLVNSYVALFRSIFVGAYERPLVTSTDAPVVKRIPSVRVPPMDLPAGRLQL